MKIGEKGLRKLLCDLQGIQMAMSNLRNHIECQVSYEDGQVQISVSYYSKYCFILVCEYFYGFNEENEIEYRLRSFKNQVKNKFGILL